MPRFNLQDKSRGWQLYHKTVIGVTALILLLPIAATVIYAFSSSWGATILPDGLTTRWFEQLLSDPRFMAAMGRSFFICLATLASSTLLVLPAVFAVFYYFPKLKDLMEILIILPFAVPPVVSSWVCCRSMPVNLSRLWERPGFWWARISPSRYRSCTDRSQRT